MARTKSSRQGRGPRAKRPLSRGPAPAGDAREAINLDLGKKVEELDRTHRILVVEDNRDVAESMQILLQDAGHEVEVAHDGPAAVEQARIFRPDVVICDIALGGEMDGFAVAASLRADARLKSAHLIALTGYGRDEDRELARRAGFDTHLTKPADPAGLKRLIGGISSKAGR
jgi:CheY-like chemotaxis protein